MDKCARIFISNLKNTSVSAKAELFARVILQETSKTSIVRSSTSSFSTTSQTLQQHAPRPQHKYLPTTQDDPDRSTDPLLPRLMDMRNGNKVPSVFSEWEFMRRLAKLRNFMYENCIGGIVFTSYHNCNYYSGFMYTAFGRPYGLAVTLDDCVTISAGIDGGHPWRRSYADNLTYTDWHRDNFYRAVRRAVGSVPGKIGLEYDHVTIENLAKFEAIWPGKEKEDISRGVMQMRMFKSSEEIKLIEEGARIADIGGAAAVEALEEGVPEFHVAQASTKAMVHEISKAYPDSDLMDTWTWFQSGINTDGAHNPVTSKIIRKGEILSLNCFPMISGYYTALERTLFLDHISKDHLKLWEVNVEVHKRGLELIQPGAKCSEIAAELNEMYRRHGLLQYRSFGYGHSFGSLCHYYGREADLELREDVDTVLHPGMVVSMEPMIMIPENKPGAGGYREHDILIVTENGNKNLTKFPFGPEHNIIKK